MDRILARVRLPKDYRYKYPHQLSGGEKQRVAIARALAARPDVVICDEITSGLDASVQASIVQLLRDIQAETGTALIFITHDLAILRHIAHRMAVMYLGEILEARAMAGLDSGPYHPYTEALLSSSTTIDPHVITRRIRLTGDLPRRGEPVKGSSFASRCPRRMGTVCDSARPPEWRFDETHSIRCHIDEDALRGTPSVWQPAPKTMEDAT